MEKKKTKLTPDFFKKIGRKGGNATLQTHGRKHFSKLGKRSMEKARGAR